MKRSETTTTAERPTAIENGATEVKYYWSLASGLRNYVIVKYGDRLSIEGRLGYYAFGSVAGYALHDHECPVEAIDRARERGEPMVWVNALASIIDCSGKTGEEKAMEGARGDARMHKLALGSVVWFEGHFYRLDSAPNRNVKLTEVRLFFTPALFGSNPPKIEVVEKEVR